MGNLAGLIPSPSQGNSNKVWHHNHICLTLLESMLRGLITGYLVQKYLHYTEKKITSAVIFCCFVVVGICVCVRSSSWAFPLKHDASRAFSILKFILVFVVLFLKQNHSVTMWVAGYVIILSCTWVLRLQRISSFSSRQENFFTWMKRRLPPWWRMPPK